MQIEGHIFFNSKYQPQTDLHHLLKIPISQRLEHLLLLATSLNIHSIVAFKLVANLLCEHAKYTN